MSFFDDIRAKAEELIGGAGEQLGGGVEEISSQIEDVTGQVDEAKNNLLQNGEQRDESKNE